MYQTAQTPNRHALKPLAAALLLCHGAATAEPAPTTPATELDRLVVTVVRDDAEEKDVARPIVIKNQTDLQQLQPASTAEALAHDVNIEASGGPRAGNQTVNIRGLEGFRVLQTVDGVRQNFSSGHRPSFFLDPVLLSNLEVLKGPASSLWGSGAIGGVVAQNTVSARDILQPDASIGGLVKHGYNDNGESHATTLAVGARGERLDILAATYYRDGNDIELGHDNQPLTGSTLANSADRDHGGLLKTEWQLTDTQALTLSLRQGESDGSIPSNGAAPPSTTSNFLIDRHTRDDSVSLDYRLDTASPLVDSQVMVYRNTTDANESRLSDGRSDSTSLETTGLNINNRSDFEHISLLYGIDGYQDEFSTERGGTNRPVPPQATTTVTGTFVQATVPVIPDVLRAEAGLRYDQFDTEADNLNTSTDEDALSPSAALVWQSTPWLELAARYDEAFRAPSAEEMYTTGTHFLFPNLVFGGGPPVFVLQPNEFVPNPNLKPEEAVNKELIARMNWADLFAQDDALGIKVSVFRNDVDQFIEQRTYDPVFSFIIGANMPTKTGWRNVDEARLEGFELEATYHFGGLRLRTGYGQTDGENRKTGESLASIPAHKFVLDTSYEFLPQQLTGGVRLTRAAEQDDVPLTNSTASYDGYTLTDLYASWQPPGKLGDALSIDLTVNNLTDEHYRYAFQELYQPGREVKLAATYRF